MVHPACRGRSQLLGLTGYAWRVITGSALRHEMLSQVYKGTATPRDQGPRAVYRGVFLPLVVFGSFINRTLYLNPKLSTSVYPSGGLLDVN